MNEKSEKEYQEYQEYANIRREANIALQKLRIAIAELQLFAPTNLKDLAGEVYDGIKDMQVVLDKFDD